MPKFWIYNNNQFKYILLKGEIDKLWIYIN